MRVMNNGYTLFCTSTDIVNGIEQITIEAVLAWQVLLQDGQVLLALIREGHGDMPAARQKNCGNILKQELKVLCVRGVPFAKGLPPSPGIASAHYRRQKAPAPVFSGQGHFVGLFERPLNVHNCGWLKGYALAVLSAPVGVFAVYSRRVKANPVPIRAMTARH